MYTAKAGTQRSFAIEYIGTWGRVAFEFCITASRMAF
jgi:hypothetical protein